MKGRRARRSDGRRPRRLSHSALITPQWRDLWLIVTPIWAVLTSSRVLFYAFERLRHPDIVPPVTADAIQGALLWPFVVTGCYLTLRTWARAGRYASLGAAIGTTLLIGALARPSYAMASVLNTNSAAQIWLESFRSAAPGYWYAWASNAVEYGALYLSCAAASVGFLSFRSLMNERLLRTRVEAAASQERLRALRTQLNPHFLFNTLNSIVSLGETHSPSAQQLVGQLGELLRRTLDASECEEHPLSEELAHVEAYLRIQQARQPSRIHWRMQISAQCRGALAPSLILLPLVENAITHGMRGTKSVHIRIVAQCKGDRLLIRVENSCGEFIAASAGCSGLGLRNVRERLQVLYGAAAALEAGRTKADYYVARIDLPLPERTAPALTEQEFICEC